MTTKRELAHRYEELTALPAGWECWEALMQEAMQEAAKAEALGEVPVGALLVAPDGTLVARAHNRTIADNDPCAHAEVLALRQAGSTLENYRLDDLVMVVTLEPCLMCVGAMVHARIRGIVYGTTDPKTGCLTSQMDGVALPFHNHAMWQQGGILADECAEQLSAFFRKRRNEHKKAKAL